MIPRREISRTFGAARCDGAQTRTRYGAQAVLHRRQRCYAASHGDGAHAGNLYVGRCRFRCMAKTNGQTAQGQRPWRRNGAVSNQTAQPALAQQRAQRFARRRRRASRWTAQFSLATARGRAHGAGGLQRPAQNPLALAGSRLSGHQRASARAFSCCWRWASA